LEKSKVISVKIKRDLQKVEKAIIDVCTSGERLLSETSLATLEAGGKRLRPALVLISGQIGEYDLNRLIPAAAAMELIHMASLVHDDILDGAATRRGTPTINNVWGNPVAVTTGDFLFANAFVLLAKINNAEVDNTACDAALSLSMGELYQMQTVHNSNQNLDDYLNKIYHKTAALFSASCEIGAVLAKGSQQEVEALAKYGKNLGMAFQIYDDVLDLEGSEKVLGKPIGIDLKDGTVTMPILFALEETKRDTRLCAVIENISPEQAEIEEAIELVHNTSAIDRTKKEAQKYIEVAIEEVKSISSKKARDDLTTIGEFVIKRYH